MSELTKEKALYEQLQYVKGANYERYNSISRRR